MSGDIDTLRQALPTAVPTEDEIRSWEALSRDEQLRLLRAVLRQEDCATVSAADMSAILAEARKRAAARSRG